MHYTNAVVYQGLERFRNAFLPFLREQLQAAYGKNWWSQAVEPAIGKDWVATTRERLEKSQSRPLAAVQRELPS